MKVLFISRAYPPTTGGIERQNYELVTFLSQLTSLRLIANKKGKKGLIFFLPYSLLSSLYKIKKENIDLVCLGDSLLAPIGCLIKLFYKQKPVVTIAHGLDIVYPNRLYQLVISRSLKRLDKIICVSRNTAQEVEKRGVNKNKITVISNGVNPKKFTGNFDKKDLEKELKIDLKDKHILLSVGHLVKRKGFHWFVEHVLPQLNDNFVYLIAGDFGSQSRGDEKKLIQQTAKRKKVEKRVHLLGRVSDHLLKILYNTADLFIMPNIKVKGDVEGFGIVAIEAASCGLPVVAAKLEGIKDAIQDDKNGFLIQSQNSKEYLKKIKTLIKQKSLKKESGQKAKQYTIKNFGWSIIVQRYLSVFKAIQ